MKGQPGDPGNRTVGADNTPKFVVNGVSGLGTTSRSRSQHLKSVDNASTPN